MSFVCWKAMNDTHLYISLRWCRAKAPHGSWSLLLLGAPSAGDDEPVDGNHDDDDDDDEAFKTVTPSLTSVVSVA